MIITLVPGPFIGKLNEKPAHIFVYTNRPINRPINWWAYIAAVFGGAFHAEILDQSSELYINDTVSFNKCAAVSGAAAIGLDISLQIQYSYSFVNVFMQESMAHCKRTRSMAPHWTRNNHHWYAWQKLCGSILGFSTAIQIVCMYWHCPWKT